MNYVIVSGANGFIGSAVIKYLIKQNIHVVALKMHMIIFPFPHLLHQLNFH